MIMMTWTEITVVWLGSEFSKEGDGWIGMIHHYGVKVRGRYDSCPFRISPYRMNQGIGRAP